MWYTCAIKVALSYNNQGDMQACCVEQNAGMTGRMIAAARLAGGAGGKNHYQMRQKMISIGDDFWIENDHGQKVFKVDGKALRVRQTLILEDAQRRELYKIQERMLRVKDSHGSRGRPRQAGRDGEEGA